MLVLRTKRQTLERLWLTRTGGLVAIGQAGCSYWPQLNDSKPIHTGGHFAKGDLISDERRLVGRCDGFQEDFGVWSVDGSSPSIRLCKWELGDVRASPTDVIVLSVGNLDHSPTTAFRLTDATADVVWKKKIKARWVRFAPNGERFYGTRWLKSGGEIGLVEFATNTGDELRVRPIEAHLYDPVVSPGERWLVGYREHALRVADLGEPTCPIHTVTNPENKKYFTQVAFHPSGRWLAAANNDTTIKLYDTTTWTMVRTITWDIGRMRCVAFNSDGTMAAAGSDSGRIVVWDFDY